MRVLQLISSSGYYGAENMLVNLSSALQEIGVNVTVGALQHEGEPEILARAREHGLDTHAFPCSGRIDWSLTGQLRRYVAAHGIDVVQTHGYKANLYCHLAKSSAAQVATCHNWAVRKGSLGFYSVLDRLALRGVPAIVAVSTNVAERLAEFGLRPPQVRTVPNGIDLARFTGAAPSLQRNRRLIGAVTRLTPGKGLDVLLNAFAQLTAKLDDVDLAIVGSGELENSLRAQAAALGIGHRVWFTGARNDMPEVYASFNVFVLPSLDEGMPMTVLEAMASQVPVVATSVGAIPELLREGRGRLVPPSDYNALARALIEALCDNTTAIPARKFVQTHYSSQAMARAYHDVYQSLRAQQAA